MDLESLAYEEGFEEVHLEPLAYEEGFKEVALACEDGGLDDRSCML